VLGQQVEVRIGERGAARCEGDEVRCRELDGQAVHRVLDDDGAGTVTRLGDRVSVEAVQHPRLVIERRACRVEVLRVIGVRVTGGLTAEEANQSVLLIQDGQFDPVPEAVDQLAAPRACGQAGGFDRGVVVTEPAQVIEQQRPVAGAAGAVAGERVSGWLGQAAVGQVPATPHISAPSSGSGMLRGRGRRLRASGW
jgi:hypothetical protein